MITFAKESQLEDVNESIFSVIYVSASKEVEGTNFSDLMPTGSDLIELSKGNMGKNKFKKSYIKFLKKDPLAIENIYYITKAIKKAKKPFVLTCSENEWKFGYIKIIVKYLEELLGIEVRDYKDALKLVNRELKDLPKKKRKLIRLSDDECSGKEKKSKQSIIKSISNELKQELSMDGDKFLEKLDERFAIEQTVISLYNDKVIEDSDSKGTIINAKDITKKDKETIIKSIVVNSEYSKEYKKIIKKALEVNSLKLSTKSLKKLDKEQLVTVLVKLSNAIRSSYTGEDKK